MTKRTKLFFHKDRVVKNPLMGEMTRIVRSLQQNNTIERVYFEEPYFAHKSDVVFY